MSEGLLCRERKRPAVATLSLTSLAQSGRNSGSRRNLSTVSFPVWKGVDRLRCFSWTSAVHVSEVRES